MKKLHFLLILAVLLSSQIGNAQIYEKYYFYKKTTRTLNDSIKDVPTEGYVKIDYNKDKVIITLHESGVISLDAELKNVVEQLNYDLVNSSMDLNCLNTYFGKSPNNQSIEMIQWTQLGDNKKYAFTFIIDGVETLYYCSELYIKDTSKSVLKFTKLKEW